MFPCLIVLFSKGKFELVPIWQDSILLPNHLSWKRQWNQKSSSFDCTCLVSTARRLDFSSVAKLYPETIVLGTQAVGACTPKLGYPSFRRTNALYSTDFQGSFFISYSVIILLHIKWRRCNFLIHWVFNISSIQCDESFGSLLFENCLVPYARSKERMIYPKEIRNIPAKSEHQAVFPGVRSNHVHLVFSFPQKCELRANS